MAELKIKLPKHGRVLALDLGEKVIGIAISDETRLIASPRDSMRRRKLVQDLASLKRIVEAESVVAVIVGNPVHMSGEMGARSRWAVGFVEYLTKEISVPIYLYDERWTTCAVERVLLQADLSRKRRSAVVDKLAACYLLQGVLDALRLQKEV